MGMFPAAKDAIAKVDGRGASTITQQLAKNLLGDGQNIPLACSEKSLAYVCSS